MAAMTQHPKRLARLWFAGEQPTAALQWSLCAAVGFHMHEHLLCGSISMHSTGRSQLLYSIERLVGAHQSWGLA